MKHTSFLHKLTAAVLSCTLCCTGMTVPAFSADDADELPARFDLRDEHAVTSVKSQYGGTCGIFSAIAAIESNMIKQGMADDSIDLSEEHFSYFSQVKGNPEDPEDPLRNDRTDNDMKAMANAGSYLDAIGILGSWMGVVPASMTPRYKDKTALDESLRYESVAHLQNVTKFNINDMKTIKKNLMEKGAMQISYFNVHTPKLYSEYGGYYQTLWSARSKKEGQDQVDGGRHAVCLVGWDDSFPKEHFVEIPPGDGAWICKNSWGVSDEDTVDGYIYISYHDPSLYDFVQFEVEPTDNYDSIYQNCCEMNNCIILRNRGIHYANVFTARQDEMITAAGVRTATANVPFRLSVYALKEDYKDPCDGTLLTQFDVAGLPAGYHTIPLDKVCQVSAGQHFSAVVEVGIQKYYEFDYDTGRIGERNTYVALYSEDTEPQWVDATKSTIFKMGNVCLKLYSKNSNEPTLRGDANRDGIVNAVDLSLLKQALLGSERTDIDRKAADWNEDKAINAEDAKGILDFLLQAEA